MRVNTYITYNFFRNFLQVFFLLAYSCEFLFPFLTFIFRAVPFALSFSILSSHSIPLHSPPHPIAEMEFISSSLNSRFPLPSPCSPSLSLFCGCWLYPVFIWVVLTCTTYRDSDNDDDDDEHEDRGCNRGSRILFIYLFSMILSRLHLPLRYACMRAVWAAVLPMRNRSETSNWCREDILKWSRRVAGKYPVGAANTW